MAKLRHLTPWLPYHRARAFSPLILTLRGVKQTIFGDFTRSSASCMCCGGIRSTNYTHIGVGYLNHSVANTLT